MMEQQYNPREHLINIRSKKTGEIKDYLPAAWRLYELHLRYQDANFSSEMVLMDVERNLVVVKCKLYLGPDYATAPRKTEALKSGLLSELDRVETAAKARCARDFGCSTEYALECEEEEEEDEPAVKEATTPQPEKKPAGDERKTRLNMVFKQAKAAVFDNDITIRTGPNN